MDASFVSTVVPAPELSNPITRNAGLISVLRAAAENMQRVIPDWDPLFTHREIDIDDAVITKKDGPVFPRFVRKLYSVWQMTRTNNSRDEVSTKGIIDEFVGKLRAAGLGEEECEELRSALYDARGVQVCRIVENGVFQISVHTSIVCSVPYTDATTHHGAWNVFTVKLTVEDLDGQKLLCLGSIKPGVPEVPYVA